jgi:succinoglycan biosynthesis transport protein ExoP
MSKFYEALKRAKKEPRGNGMGAVSDANKSDAAVNDTASQPPPQRTGVPSVVTQSGPRRTDAEQTPKSFRDGHGTNAVSDAHQIDATANYTAGQNSPGQPGVPVVIKQSSPMRTDADQTQVLDIKQIGATVINNGGQNAPQQQGISIVVKEGGSRRASAEQTEALDIRRYLLLLRKRRSLFAIVAAIIISAAVVVSYIIPPFYEAQTVVSIERNLLNDISKGLTMTPSLDSKISPLAAIMKSRTLIYKVISDLDLDLGRKNEAEMENLIKSIQDRTEVKLEFNKVSRNNIDFFTVSFQDRDPKMAKDYVNTLVGKYIEESLKFNREASTGTNSFLLDQINLVKAKVGKLDGEIVRLKEKDAEIEQSKKKEEEIALLKENRPSVADSRALELKKLKKRLDYLLVHYTPNFPEVTRVKADIESLKAEIKASPRNPAGATSPVKRSDGKSKFNEAASSDVKTRLAELERERDTNQRIYDELSAAYGISHVSAEAEIQDKVGRFRIVDPAILPIKPVSPNRIKIMLLGILAGIAGAFGLIVILDMSDKSVKSVGMLKNFGLPVIVVPHMQNPGELKKNRRNNFFFYGLSSLYVMLLAAVIVRELIKTLG